MAVLLSADGVILMQRLARLGERLCSLPLRWRLALLMICWLSFAAGCWLGWLLPLYQHQTTLQQETTTLHQRHHLLTHKLRQLSTALAAAPAPDQQATDNRHPTAFAPLSPLHLAHGSGMRLIHWQPASENGSSLTRLTLSGNWQQVLTLFDLLAQSEVLPHDFSVQPDTASAINTAETAPETTTEATTAADHPLLRITLHLENPL